MIGPRFHVSFQAIACHCALDPCSYFTWIWASCPRRSFAQEIARVLAHRVSDTWDREDHNLSKALRSMCRHTEDLEFSRHDVL